MAEGDRKPEYEGRLGHSVAVKIHSQNSLGWDNEGEVTALDPRKKVGDWQQPKGLYLETVNYVPDILSVTTTDMSSPFFPYVEKLKLIFMESMWL